ncbi:LysR family glycine cleavage system transcriptional activator [Rhizobium sp. SG_E_25_P2]|uniref:LysR substrate-binding domain-containing protein n=1 Tax=Rhizobium sp. SG_E_25_P2 TaxID=2879942 RepID=UPI00247656E7|nr:LysR substrate-binding domain-containing protein [Rhizobium sp. SG_E_25_P2]MDH6264981.1 LysR family glycine cleavage system transcriptional activator [Rhizobium sp. SG_E_25_P2]
MRNLNLVHLNGLRALEAVGRAGTLQAAADELGVTPGAISQQLAKAEAQLGKQIFERRPKGLALTEAGRVALPKLTQGFGLLSQAVASVRGDDDRTLTISVAPVFAARWLVRRLDGFFRLHPEIDIRIDATSRLVDPSASDIDLAIRVGRGDWPGVEAELLLEQEIFPVAAPALTTHLTEPRDILALPAVIDSQAMFGWDIWLNAADLHGEAITPRHRLSEASLCLDAVISGQGVMLGWQTLTVDAILGGCLCVPFPIRARTGFAHYIVTAKGGRETAKAKAFKAWLKGELADSMAALDAAIGRQEPAL